MAFQVSLAPQLRASENMMQTLTGIGQQIGQQRQQSDQQQQQRAQQAQMQEVISRAATGDADSINELMTLNPDLALRLEQREAEKFQKMTAQEALESKKAETDWGIQWKQAGDDQERKDVLLQEALANPLIEIDEEDVGFSGPQSDLAVNAMLMKNLGLEEYKALTVADDVDRFQQGSGVMSGYKFDRETGGYSIEPAVQGMLSDKAEAEKEKARVNARKVDAKTRQGINKDFTGLIADAVGIDGAARSLAKLKETSTATDQLAAIFKFMKSLDPTSVVREGEQQMAKSTGGPADAFVGFVNQIQGEGGLTATAFSNMVNTAAALADSAVGSASESASSYLETYEETIPKGFKDRLMKRIPERKSSLLSDEDLLKKYGG